ncbi:hypothetical protein GCM10028807_41990 [Spirosoma daeguense]
MHLTDVYSIPLFLLCFVTKLTPTGRETINFAMYHSMPLRLKTACVERVNAFITEVPDKN